MLLAARFLPVLVVALLGLTAWIVAASVDHEAVVGHSEPSVSESSPGWLSIESSDDALAFMTHGTWQCPNADCRYRAMSGGEPFRSAAAQDCTLCREALVPHHPGGDLP